VRSDRCPCLLCGPSSHAIEPFALACDYSGGAGATFDRVDGASGLILALTADRTWAGALVTAVAAALAFATRLNPLWLLLAGGCLGFAGVI
jgi:hypothetical protein